MVTNHLLTGMILQVMMQHSLQIYWNLFPGAPCREYLPTWTVKNGHIQGEM